MLRPVTATRSFQVGLSLVGARSDRTYSLSDRSRDRSRSAAPSRTWTGWAAPTLVATLDVTGLTSGTAPSRSRRILPAGVDVRVGEPGQGLGHGDGPTAAPIFGDPVGLRPPSASPGG